MELRDITGKEVKSLLAGRDGIRRKKDSHKGDYGRVLVVAGSRGMVGAAVLCAKAALRAGSGLVTVALDEEFFPIVQSAVPEAMCALRMRTSNISKEALNEYDAVAIGPGLGKDASASGVLAHILSAYEGKLVIDADALNLLAEKRLSLKNAPADIVITPHPGEAAGLLEVQTAQVQGDRPSAAKALQGKFACTVVLKGSGTLVASPGERDIRINTTGNPGMATGGSGDVLTGLIASLLGQGMRPMHAATAGVYIHGKAGDIMAERHGEAGLIAGDLALGIALAMHELQ
jgi:NAD(P)H-hydrate epimerase